MTPLEQLVGHGVAESPPDTARSRETAAYLASAGVPAGCRPSPERAAAAALLTGLAEDRVAPAGPTFDVLGRGGPDTGEADPDAPGATPQREGDRTARRHLQVVEARQRTPAERRRRVQALAVAGVGFGLAVALALVYLHVVLAQRQFRLDRLDSQVQSEQAAYQTLRLEVAQLGSPANIISTAEGRLGMVQPGTVTYIPTDSSGLTTLAGTPATLPSVGSASKRAVVEAPQGDADWPMIKSQLAGSQ